METKTNNNQERVEVMALFGYEMTPCQPLSFRRRGDVRDTEVTELLATTVKFIGGIARHIFDVTVGGEHCQLEFDSRSLAWYLTAEA
ncbi:MAG: hypothetical protein Q4E46_01735 [Candidatus Saccharibacteria bacterium]|nr:hypothetical protein [Candidatus Saccharibacteria bacterium]MBR1796043.1 hypothetical protein [Candidatus Saccharibacteria bacterium]MDO4987021.1 hypothetical protein [Candidatus Saccharibacteria bacterium]